MSKYYEDRIKKGIYKTYNSLEERNIELLKFYKQASDDIRTELYKIAEKVQKATNKDEISLTDMHRFKRLKALNEKNLQIVEKLASKTETFGKEGMIEGFEKIYSEASAAVGNIDFAMPNEQLMEELFKRPWRGSYFSERLWKNSEKLGKALNDTLRIGLQQGRTVAQIAIELDNVMQKGFNVAHRLVRTETMHFLNQSSLQAYADAGITHVKDVVTMDERTSSQCAGHNGKIYPIDKAPVLPRHPNCRCTLAAVVDVGEENVEKSLEEEYNKKRVEPAYRPLTKEQIERFQKLSDSIFASMGVTDPEVKKALQIYTSGGYLEINKHLAGVEGFEDFAEYIPQIQKAMSKFELSEDIIVYRGTKAKHFENLKIGDSFDGNIFYSTSYEKSVGLGFRDASYEEAVLLTIEVPKGTSCLFIGENTAYDDEGEILLDCTLRYIVKERSEKNITLEVIESE